MTKLSNFVVCENCQNGRKVCLVFSSLDHKFEAFETSHHQYSGLFSWSIFNFAPQDTLGQSLFSSYIWVLLSARAFTIFLAKNKIFLEWHVDKKAIRKRFCPNVEGLVFGWLNFNASKKRSFPRLCIEGRRLKMAINHNMPRKKIKCNFWKDSTLVCNGLK